MRFIDLATDGGCSKKADANELSELLRAVADRSESADMYDIAKSFPDSATYLLGGVSCLSTVDIVLPMVLNAADFGRIAVNHVLGDIYAAFGSPQFALSILGLPYGLRASDGDVVEAMVASTREFQMSGARLIGGHTLAKQADFSLGFSVVGLPMQGHRGQLRQVRIGDPVYLTKPLGTSAATLLWKHETVQENDLLDVLASMLEPSKEAARLLYEAGVPHCTDVTGFGLANHLHRLLMREGVAASVQIAAVPGFASLDPFYAEGLPTSSLYYQNLEFASRFSNTDGCQKNPKAPLIFDAQVAGGLLFVCPDERSFDVTQRFDSVGIKLFQIGNCVSGNPGEVFFS